MLIRADPTCSADRLVDADHPICPAVEKQANQEDASFLLGVSR